MLPTYLAILVEVFSLVELRGSKPLLRARLLRVIAGL